MRDFKEIFQGFRGALNSMRKPAHVISTIIMLCALAKRPGLSCLISTSNIIQDLSKKGCPTGPLPDGSPNLMNELVASVVCETFRALKEDANIQLAIPPGSLNIQVTGGNAGGPFVGIGSNIAPGSGWANLQ